MKKWILLLCICLAAKASTAQETSPLKAKAYELYQAKRFDDSAKQFEAYLQEAPGDTAAAIDFAALLSELNRHAQAATLLESVRQKAPRNEAATFKLAVEYVALKRYDDAFSLFSELAK